jgi:hypothetical protein
LFYFTFCYKLPPVALTKTNAAGLGLATALEFVRSVPSPATPDAVVEAIGSSKYATGPSKGKCKYTLKRGFLKRLKGALLLYNHMRVFSGLDREKKEVKLMHLRPMEDGSAAGDDSPFCATPPAGKEYCFAVGLVKADGSVLGTFPNRYTYGQPTRAALESAPTVLGYFEAFAEAANGAPSEPSEADLLKFHIAKAPELGKRLHAAQLRELLRPSIRDIEGAAVFIPETHWENGMPTTSGQQRFFESIKKKEVKKKDLVSYLLSRRMYNNKIKREELYKIVSQQIKIEARKGKFSIESRDDFKSDNSRALGLVKAGILNRKNAPNLFPPASFPSLVDDDRWKLPSAAFCKSLDPLTVLQKHFSSVYSASTRDSHYVKALSAFSSKKVLELRYIQEDNFVFFVTTLGASGTKSREYCVRAVVKVNVGRSYDDSLPAVVHTSCLGCAAGKRGGCCRHQDSILAAIFMAALGKLKFGVGTDGNAAWRESRFRNLKTTKSRLIALLTPGGFRLLSFTGRQPDSPPFESLMGEFVKRRKQRRARGESAPVLMAESVYNAQMMEAMPLLSPERRAVRERRPSSCPNQRKRSPQPDAAHSSAQKKPRERHQEFLNARERRKYVSEVLKKVNCTPYNERRRLFTDAK